MFLSYVQYFPAILTAMASRRRSNERETAGRGPVGDVPVGFGQYKDMTRQEIYDSTDPQHQQWLLEVMSLAVREPGRALDKLQGYVRARRLQEEEESRLLIQAAEPFDDMVVPPPPETPLRQSHQSPAKSTPPKESLPPPAKSSPRKVVEVQVVKIIFSFF